MKLAAIKNLRKSYGDREILNIEKFEVEENDKIGLVGGNGAGKTTLLKILIGEEEADSGNIYLDQSYSYISQLDDHFKSCTDSKIKKIFKAPTEYCEYLSGGEKVKMRVVSALEENCSLIIADEPTSNLDAESIAALMKMFKKYKGSLLVVSHDRQFLNYICNKICELEDGKLTLYKGNYDDYLRLKEENYLKQKNEHEKYVHEKARLESVINEKEVLRDRIKKAPKGMGKSEAKTIKMGDQRGKKHIENNIKSIEKRIEHLDKVEAPKKKQKIVININDGSELKSKNVVGINDYRLMVKDKVLADKINLNLKSGDKIALIGPNGCGKTTLLKKIIAGNEKGIKLSPAVKIGYFDQKQAILEEEKSILENIKNESSWDETFIRINLSEFGFKNEAVNELVKDLSGGEKVKVAICKIILADNNLLILDEPTNYLDIVTIEALENALINIDKTVILVSHDIEFIKNICNYIVEFKNNSLIQFKGTYAEYINSANKNEDKQQRHIDDEILLLDNKIAEIINLLSLEKNEDVKKKLNQEFLNLSQKLNILKEQKNS